MVPRRRWGQLAGTSELIGGPSSVDIISTPGPVRSAVWRRQPGVEGGYALLWDYDEAGAPFYVSGYQHSQLKSHVAPHHPLQLYGLGSASAGWRLIVTADYDRYSHWQDKRRLVSARTMCYPLCLILPALHSHVEHRFRA